MNCLDITKLYHVPIQQASAISASYSTQTVNRYLDISSY